MRGFLCTSVSSVVNPAARLDLETVKEKRWDEAIEVYERASNRFPDCFQLRKNQAACWISKAKPILDKKDWKAAVEIYEKANESTNRKNLTVLNNLRYCRSKLEAEKKEK